MAQVNEDNCCHRILLVIKYSQNELNLEGNELRENGGIVCKK